MASDGFSDYSSSSNEHDSASDGDDFDGLKPLLRGYSDSMRAYLEGNVTHPLWEPAVTQDNIPAWEQSDLDRLKSLGMLKSPSYGEPDMLLYRVGHLEDLDPHFRDRLEAVLEGGDHVYLSNASGTGKTRMSFEILSHHWGLYLTCHADYMSDPYGSGDIAQAVSYMSLLTASGAEFTTSVPLSGRPSQRSKDALDANRRIAQFCFRRLLLARLLLQNEFLKLVTALGTPDDEARHKWLAIQLRSADLLRDDVFKSLFIWLKTQPDDLVTRITESFVPEALSRVSYIVVDEAQAALNWYRSAFATTGDRTHAPVLRELVICLGAFYPAARLILSGVQFDLSVVTESLRASAFVQKTVRHFHAFGHFASLRQSSSYIQHFLGSSASDEACELVYRWMHGRHRAIAVLVALSLRYGARNITRVLDSLLYRWTGYQRPGCSLINSQQFKGLATIVTNEQAEASPVAAILRKAVIASVIQHIRTTTRSCSRDLVHLAVALYGNSAEEAIIFEPFILLNLARWLTVSTNYGIHGIIRRRLIDDTAYPLHSVAFVEGLAACMLDSFHTAPSLDSVFVFPGRKPPWAGHGSRMVLPHMARRTSRFTPVECPAPASIHCAATPADVLEWFDHASELFLIPDPAFGADLLFMLEVHDASHVLVCVHAEPFSSFRGRRQNRVVPPDPDTFYQSEPGAHAHFLAVLNSLPPLLLNTVRPSGKGAHAKLHHRFARFSTLHVLCFERPFREEAYDPPAVSVNFEYVLGLSRPVEFTFSSLEEFVTRP